MNKNILRDRWTGLREIFRGDYGEDSSTKNMSEFFFPLNFLHQRDKCRRRKKITNIMKSKKE